MIVLASPWKVRLSNGDGGSPFVSSLADEKDLQTCCFSPDASQLRNGLPVAEVPLSEVVGNQAGC